LIKSRFAFRQRRKKKSAFVFSKQANFSSLRTAKSESRNYQLISKNPLIFSQICPPKRGAKPRARRLIQYGGVCWTMSEFSLSKIQRILLIDPPSVSARLRFASASKTEKFS
jgi:hypothetical protein